MDRRPLPQGDEGMTSWFGFLSFVGHDTYRQRASGFLFFGAGCRMAFSEEPKGKKCFLGRNGFGTRVHGGDFILSFCLAARTFGGVILLFFLTYPPHLDGGCLARRERGRTFGDTLCSLLFIWAGGYGHLRESLHFIDWVGLDGIGWEERWMGFYGTRRIGRQWLCMG